MKTFLIIIGALCALKLWAVESETLSGDKAFELYKSLPGATCTEWISREYVVYTKYSTENCSDISDLKKWNCTIQLSKINKNSKLLSASCTRELN